LFIARNRAKRLPLQKPLPSPLKARSKRRQLDPAASLQAAMFGVVNRHGVEDAGPSRRQGAMSPSKRCLASTLSSCFQYYPGFKSSGESFSLGTREYWPQGELAPRIRIPKDSSGPAILASRFDGACIKSISRFLASQFSWLNDTKIPDAPILWGTKAPGTT